MKGHHDLSQVKYIDPERKIITNKSHIKSYNDQVLKNRVYLRNYKMHDQTLESPEVNTAQQRTF